MLLIASYLVMKTLLFSCVKSDDDLCVVLLLTFVSTVNFSDELLTSTFGKSVFTVVVVVFFGVFLKSCHYQR